MELRRPHQIAAAAALCLLAGLPAALGNDVPAEVGPQPEIVTVSGQPPAYVPGSTTSVPTTTSYKGTVRSFVLHVPDGLLAPAPLVVALHARSQGPTQIRAISRLEQLADEQGFVVAFPGGAGGSWNAGACCAPGTREGVDDVAFLDEVVALARSRALIDPDRISFTGGSNGAMMALRYACERPEVVASVAVISGPLVAPCTPGQPVAVFALHGADDAVVPLAGGPNAGLDVTFPSVDASLEPFRAAGGEVELAVVPGGGHDWMTRLRDGVDATRIVWEWMRDHPRR